MSYRKIPKISPGAYVFQRPLLRGLYPRKEIDWASLVAGSKFTVFALFYFVFERNFPSTSPPGGGGLYFEGRFNGGFFFCVTGLGGLYLEGLIYRILRHYTRSTSLSTGNY